MQCLKPDPCYNSVWKLGWFVGGVVWLLLFRWRGGGWQREILQILNLPSEVGISVNDSLYINFCIRPYIIIHNCKTCRLHFYIFGSNWALERGHGITVSISVFHVLSVEKYICTKINSFSLLTVEGWFQKILPPGSIPYQVCLPSFRISKMPDPPLYPWNNSIIIVNPPPTQIFHFFRQTL